MQVPLKQKLFYFFPVMFCFCLPFGTFILSVLAAGWGLVSFFNIEKKRLSQGLKNNQFLLMISFFALTCVSAALSTNTHEALNAIEVKLTCLLFPYCFFCFHWPIQVIKRMIVSFVSGCFFACLYLIVRACIYALNGDNDHFFYNNFSDLLHPSYFSMYLMLAIIFVMSFYHKWFAGHKPVLYSSYFFILVFATCIFLCSSKMGIISFFVCLPLLFAKRFLQSFNLKRIGLFLAAGALLILITSTVFPGAFSRLGSVRSLNVENIDKTASESTAVRILIWQQCIAIVELNFLFGTGVGDANDELYKAYDANGLTGALNHHLNAHNQYFQTFIGLGVFGFIVVAMLTLGQLVFSIQRKGFLLFLFSLLLCLNFLVESMLQTVAGVLFFALFYSLITSVKEQDLKGA